MSDTSTFLSLPYLQPSQAQKHVTHNEALRRLDALVQISVVSLDETVPPDPAMDGARHIVGAGATGVWDGRDGQIAVFQDGVWHFITASSGWLVHVQGSGVLAAFDGAAWLPLQPAMLGVNSTADTVNRLSLRSAGALFSHDGADHRLTINKAAMGDTASLLFQSGFSGRAEMGLAGEEDFSVKVSADGVNWTTALRVDATTGQLDAGDYGGDGVQDGALDNTAGRLMKLHGDGGSFGLGGMSSPLVDDLDDASIPTGFYRTSSDTVGTFPPGVNKFGQLMTVRHNSTGFNQVYADVLSPTCWLRSYRQQSGGFGDWVQGYHSGNILGPVALAGGVPSGAVLEHVETAGGRALRLADGSQVLSTDLILSQVSPGLLEATWTFPAAVVGAAHLTGSVDAAHLAANAAPGADEIGAVQMADVTTATAKVQLRRIAGRTDFLAGDTARVHLTAVARWVS